ncbi:MAG: hypothetical protein AABW56_00805 [Nanoarchaeota archaeon]
MEKSIKYEPDYTLNSKIIKIVKEARIFGDSYHEMYSRLERE